MTARVLLLLLLLASMSSTAYRIQLRQAPGRNTSASSMAQIRSILRSKESKPPMVVTNTEPVTGVAHRRSTHTGTGANSSVFVGDDIHFQPAIVYCNFERPCLWNGSVNEFVVRSGADVAYGIASSRLSRKPTTGPVKDADGQADGHFMYSNNSNKAFNNSLQLKGQWLTKSHSSMCNVNFMFHAANIVGSMLAIYVHQENGLVHVKNLTGVATNNWLQINQHIGMFNNPFYIVFEVWAPEDNLFHVAFDNILVDSCFQDVFVSCTNTSFECEPGLCIAKDRVCDVSRDCPNGSDEDSRCDPLRLYKAWCDFENDTCGWENSVVDDLDWIRTDGHHDVSAKYSINDHTYGNASGHFLTFNSSRASTFGHSAVITSAIFLAPPRSHGNFHSPNYNSCQVRFHYYMSGADIGGLILETVEQRPIGRQETQEHKIVVWQTLGQKDKDWVRVSMPLPNQTQSYRLQFTVSQSRMALGNVSIDDISLSQACFGIGLLGDDSNAIFLNSTNGIHPPGEPIGNPMNNVSTVYKFTTCGKEGRLGPTNEECTQHYKDYLTVEVADNSTLAGIQQWTVPETGVYSVIAGGAGGGLGFNNKRPSKGATARAVFNWSRGEVIYILVGQMGIGPCHKNCTEFPKQKKFGFTDLFNAIKEDKTEATIGGGGGGGATFVFKMSSSGQCIPLLVAAGGGGLATSTREGLVIPDGNGEPQNNMEPANGKTAIGGAGGGGGWKGTRDGGDAVGGLSLLAGALGGKSCNRSTRAKAVGGFGGGGGACRSGGGGGGYIGGVAVENTTEIENGHGGYTFVSGFYAHSATGGSEEQGSVQIYPSFTGCGCHYLCVILDARSAKYICICPEGYKLDENRHDCIVGSLIDSEKLGTESIFAMEHLLIIIPVTAIILIGITTVMFFLYQRYRRQMAQTTRQEYVNNPELQLSRLRQQVAGGMITEYNPNYEFGGSICTLQDLCQISRENITLVKNLGQGAFGEVYQGYLSNIPGELRDIPVAIKTLPELSAAQADKDFLMEALIMSKFHHPNIVKFIGVCFEKLPKFIVLELLPGGDLKNFLRDARPKPDNPPVLIMRDLLILAVDVAKGCLYLEENHFIHRDIAARNCLLTTKDVTRVVKIADFGMARDIYRADYYRKGGKAMLPVKWMPPEAFLDGIFTSKTDVWSFGVLLWEVMSLGYMPYPGRGNQDVMQLVTSGGRLEPPSNCPLPVYQIMSQCWSPIPDDRPNFRTILERLGYCLQDPDVTKACLPVFHRPPSSERDATVMRPPDADSVCLQVQRLAGDNEPQSPASTDYLIPIPSSSYSLCTEKTELPSAASSMESVDQLLELDDAGKGDATPVASSSTTAATTTTLKPTSSSLMTAAASNRPAGNWETSFMQSVPKTAPTSTSTAGSLPRQVAPMWSGSGAAYHSIPTQEEDLPPPPPSPPQPSSHAVPTTPYVYPATSTTLPLATIPPPESSPARKSPPSAIARQRPSVKKPVTSSGNFAVDKLPSFGENDGSEGAVGGAAAASPPLQQPLDASTLPKQHPAQVLPYANVDVSVASAGPRTTTTGSPKVAPVVHNEPYTITAPRGAAPPSNKGKYDKDAKC